MLRIIPAANEVAFAIRQREECLHYRDYASLSLYPHAEGDRDALAIQGYLKSWPEWFGAQRQTFSRANNPNLWQRVFSTFVTQQPSRLKSTLLLVDQCDPSIDRPIVKLFLNAAVEALASLSAYREYFERTDALGMEPEILKHLNELIEISASNLKTPESLLFRPMMDGYEHIFSFAIKMLDQFRKDYERLPDLHEFDQLRLNLAQLLFGETQLSRRDNIVLETSFSQAERFFSFEQSGDGIRSKIIHPDSARQEEIIRLFLQSAGVKDDKMQKQEKTRRSLRMPCRRAP